LWAGLERQDSAEKSAGRTADRLAEIAIAEQPSQRAASEASQCAAQYPAKEALWRQLRSGIELRTSLERQEPSELTGEAADLLAEALVAERAADGGTDRRTDLSEQIAEEALWCELRTRIEWQEALSKLTGEAADLLAEALVAERVADSGTNRRTDLTKQVAEEALRRELRASVEWQEASKLAGDIADGLTEALIAERSADNTTERRADLTEQIAEEALRCELRTRVEWQEALSKLTGDAADLLAEALVAKRVADETTEWRTDLTEQIAEEALWCELRTRVEWQKALSKLTGDAADLLAEALVAKRVADETTERRADLAEQIAEEALRRELRTRVEWQEASELTGDAADLLAEALIAERTADHTAKRRADLAKQIAKEALGGELLSGEQAVRRRCLQCSVHHRIHLISSSVAVKHTQRFAILQATSGIDRKIVRTIGATTPARKWTIRYRRRHMRQVVACLRLSAEVGSRAGARRAKSNFFAMKSGDANQACHAAATNSRAKRRRGQLGTSTVVSTDNAPPRTRISRTG
jgi:hypothetical protein